MTAPWSSESVAPKTESKHPQSHNSKNFGIKDITSVLHSVGADMIWTYTTCHVLYKICLRPRKTWSECVKTDISDCGLTGVDSQDRCAKMHGETVFGLAWCCQPHWMGHGQHGRCDSWDDNSVKSLSKCIRFYSRKCIWNCRLKNGGHFVSASMW